MPHGIRTWVGGSLTLDVTDRITRIVYDRYVGKNDQGSTTITLPSVQCRAIAVLDEGTVDDYAQIPHKVDLATDGTLSWSRHSSSDIDSGPTRILVISDG